MNDAPLPNWKPSPELLAAFGDGELDARDDAAELRARLEDWLAKNPLAQADLAANRRLKSLFDRAAPPAPSPETWREVMTRLEHMPAPAQRRAPSMAWLVGMGAAAACLLWAVLLAGSYWKTPTAAAEVFAVATDDDIEILHVEGNAIDSLVVGLQPLIGMLELADPGEVVIKSVTPDPRDNMVPVVHNEGPSRPMIWATPNEGR